MQDLDKIVPTAGGNMDTTIYDPANKQTQLAADNEVVHLGASEIITGGKTFTSTPITPANTYTKEPTGFISPYEVIRNYNPTTRKITLTGNTTALWYGQIVPELVSGWVSPAHDDTFGYWYLFFNGSNFVWQNSIWTFDILQIGQAVYFSGFKFGVSENHGLMQWQVHQELHQNIGTYKNSGGAISGITLSSNVAANRRPIVASTVIGDEDLDTILPTLNNSTYTKLSLTGASVPTFTPNTTDIIPLLANNPYYNSFNTPNWGQTLFPSNSCGTVWLLGIPVTSDTDSQKYRYIFIQPQWITTASSGSAGNLLAARNTEELRTSAELNLGGLATEYVVFARFTVQFTTNWTIEKVINITGTKNNQINVPQGNYLLGVTTSGKAIGGAGTPANPLYIKDINGWADYTDATTQTTPINYVAPNSIILTNDTVGAYTVTTYLPADVTGFWNAVTNRIDFSQLTLGDRIQVEVEIIMTTVAPNTLTELFLTLGSGLNAYSKVSTPYFFKLAGTYTLRATFTVTMSYADTLNSPGIINFKSSDNCTIKVNGCYFSTIRRNN